MINKYRRLAGLGAIVVGSGLIGCDGENGPLGGALPVDEIIAQCGLSCPEGNALADGNFAITGTASIDSFFAAVVNIDTKATLVASAVAEAQAKMALLMGLEAGASAEDIVAAFDAEVSANVEGDITVIAQPPKCQASVEATVEATAKCDAEVTPGSAMVACEGTCEAKAGVMAECSGGAELKCSGTAPSLKCSGVCKGECTAKVDAQGGCVGSCEGSCDGTCTLNLDGSAECPGTCTGTLEGGNCKGGCEVEMSGDAMCEGTCDGSCSGECNAEIDAEGNCSGQCEGDCEYTPGEAGCSADANVQCEASAEGSVMCDGQCEGEVVPPMAKAECQASAKAEAEANVECTPPTIALDYNFAANVDAQAQAEFEAKITGFFNAYAELLAQAKVLASVQGAGTALISAAADLPAAIRTEAEAALDAGDIALSFKLGCGITAMANVEGVITGAGSRINTSISAITTITTGVTS